MAQVYRKSALEKLSSPDQLDKALTIISPMSWLALLAATVAIVVTVIWSIVGTIPVTVTASGIVASPVSTNAVYMPESGTIQTVGYVQKGSALNDQTLILTYTTGTGELKNLVSDQFGTVDSVKVKHGDTVFQNNEVLRLNPAVDAEQVIVCYLSIADAKKIYRGMEANVTLASADSQTYGHMRARVINIDAYASSTEGMSYVLGSGNNMAATFQKDGAAVVAVTLQLYPASADSPTRSGYWWSNERGAREQAVANGSLVTAKIITEEVHPITKLFTKLKEIWGGN